MRLEIDGDRDAVEFLDAGDLWGKGTYATQKLLSRKHQHAVIGPAGENLVLFAGIVSNERIAGRTGVGAVMGSKLLKAVSVRGSRKLDMEDPEKFKAYTKEVRKLFEDHPVLGESMKRFGTGGIVNTTNGRNILPTRNFQKGHFDRAMDISGEFIEDHELKGVKTSCIHCPVTCGRDVEVEGVGVVKGPEYETLALLGSNLEIGDIKKVVRVELPRRRPRHGHDQPRRDAARSRWSWSSAACSTPSSTSATQAGVTELIQDIGAPPRPRRRAGRRHQAAAPRSTAAASSRCT